MSRPRQQPPAADHVRHDALLVAQFAAGDPLEQARRDEAAVLVSGCAECAALVADLRTVAMAVAWEPIPPRRRDFRLSAEEAERARGSTFDRFMRRLAMPRSSRLRPLAAGVMSLGFAFVLAGNLWPEDVLDASITQEVTAPVVQVTPAGEPAADTLPSATLEQQDLSLESESTAASPPAGTGRSIDEFADDVSRNDRAQAADGPGQEVASKASGASAAEAGSDAIDTAADGSAAPLPPSVRLGEAAVSPNDLDTLAAPEPESAATEAGLAATEAGPAASSAGAADARVTDDVGESASPLDPGGAVALEATVLPRDEALAVQDDGTSVETVLIMLGTGLLVGGLVLWLLVEVARRRTPDPLAR